MVVQVIYITIQTLCEERVNKVMMITFNNSFCFMIIRGLVVKVKGKASWP
jgi:hypothetical protein